MPPCPRALAARPFRLALVAAAVAAATAVPARAQGVGPLKWQLQPYCNVVTFTATPEAAGFRLAGVDDGCGTTASPAEGRATINADGSVTLAFVVIAADGTPIHTSSRLPPG